MANNTTVNKVVYGTTTIIDISDSTVDASHLAEGYTAYDKSGTKITGELSGGSTIIRDELDSHGGTIRHITTGEIIEGTVTITTNGTHDVSNYVNALVNVNTEPTLETKSVSYTPTESQQTDIIIPSSGYDGIGKVDVTVDAISSTYVGSGIMRRTSNDLTISDATITVPSGYYASSASTSVVSGTEGTPTATKGTVSNNSISVTPSVTNTTGYISGGTKTGTAVSVSASELVSGTKTITNSGTTDVTNYASASVASGSATTPATTITANPTISVDSSGLITATTSASQSITPTVSAGYVSTGTSGTISVIGSNTNQLTTKAAATITPTTTDQTIASGQYLTGIQTIEGIVTENLTASNIISGVTVKVGTATDDDSVISVTGTASGSSTTIEPLSVTQNGIYTAPSGYAYSPVTVNVSGGGYSGGSWVRPSDWPDLSQMDVSSGDILYMTSYADEARGFCEFSVICTGSYTVEVGTISGSTFTAESTQTYSSNTFCKLYYGSTNGTYKVLRVTGTAITKLSFTGNSTVTIGTFYGFGGNQGIIDIVGKLPSGTGLTCSYLCNLVNVEIDGLHLTNMNSMFSSCYSLTSVDVSGWDTSSVTTMSSMFSSCYSLTSLDVSGWNTSRVKTMSSMFSSCNSLTSIDVSGWNTSSVTVMSNIFYNCNSLTSLDVSGWDTSSVTTMSSMFSSCYSLTSLDVSRWDTSSVTNMNATFGSCYSLTSVDVSRWKTSSVTNMANMFQNCNSLTSVDVSKWDISSVTTMAYMFNNCNSLTSVDVSGWDTSSVTVMNGMFQNCYSLTSIDVSGWDTSSVTTMANMFYYCFSLTSINVSGWDFSGITTATSTAAMFNMCYGLHGSLTIPNTCAYIGTQCFSNCRSLYEWHFLATTPPVLGSTNAFNHMADFDGKKIYVPSASLEAYQTATSWSTYASYMVGE